MKDWLKVLIITVVVAAASVPLGQVIWPAAAGSELPSGIELPLFIILAVIEGITLGLGISFLLLGWPLVRRITNGYRSRAVLCYLAIAWLMVSWWPHDGFHRSIGEDTPKLLMVEYGFHVTLMLSAIVLGYTFVTLLRDRLPARSENKVAAPSQVEPAGL
jgi:hypothetical protein